MVLVVVLLLPMQKRVLRCCLQMWKRQRKQTESALKQTGAEVFFVKTDVRSESDIINLMETAKRTYGRIDVLINNAGKGLFKSVYEVTVEEWDDIIRTNLRSVFLCSREAAKFMRDNEDGERL